MLCWVAEEQRSVLTRNSATKKRGWESGGGVIWKQGKTPSPKPQSRLSINFILMPRSVADECFSFSVPTEPSVASAAGSKAEDPRNSQPLHHYKGRGYASVSTVHSPANIPTGFHSEEGVGLSPVEPQPHTAGSAIRNRSLFCVQIFEAHL